MAEALRHFASGRTANFDFEDELLAILAARIVDWKDDDAALWAIQSKSWFLYDDIRRHRLDGKRRLNRGGRREIARWIVFLHAGHEYEWPVRNFISFRSCLLRVLTLGLAESIIRPYLRIRDKAMGEWKVWPFIRKEDLEAELRRPRLLAGPRPS
ncbi:MAG TPA: hypothetical protein VFC78_17460 [Tepidisphaeraceae bacterium]|nr:hypothetical protein [Tepidisphaeraceae bacterium]